MARITVEDCLKQIDNQFDLILVAAKRARRLANGADALVDVENDKPTVIALREIAAGLITEEILEQMTQPEEDILSSEQAEELLASTPLPGPDAKPAEFSMPVITPSVTRTPTVAAPASTPEVAAPASTPEVAAPASTPEAAAPASTPEAAAPASTPEAAAPASTPEVAAPASTPEVAAPVAAAEPVKGPDEAL